jgi:thioredoxin-like negative regulator of GroEL
MLNWSRGLPGHPARAILVFYAPTCGFCHAYLPIVAKVAGQFRGRLSVFTVDVSQGPRSPSSTAKLSRTFANEGVPVTVFMANGAPVGRQVGLINEATLRGMLAQFTT